MKNIIPLLILILLSCKKQNEIEPGFNKIDKKIVDRNYLINKIEPDTSYQYWQYVQAFPYLKNKDESIIKQSGDTLLRNKYKIINPKKGFFVECQPATCYSFIAYIQNDKVNYITDEKGLKRFIGKIKSLEEAMLIAKINNLWFDSEEMIGGAYKKTENGYELYLKKSYDCPIKFESVKTKIDSTGNLSSKSNGVYFESKDCIVF